MERLTRSDGALLVHTSQTSPIALYEQKMDAMTTLTKRLSEYENMFERWGLGHLSFEELEKWHDTVEQNVNKLEQVKKGSAVELPCRPGSTIYRILYRKCHNGGTSPDSFECRGCDSSLGIYMIPNVSLKFILNSFFEFGVDDNGCCVGRFFTSYDEAMEAKERWESHDRK